MGWKDLSSGKKGAIFGAVIGIILAVFLSSTLFCKLAYNGYFRVIGISMFPNGCIINDMSNESLGMLNPLYTFITFIILVLVGYLLGYAIGRKK